MARRKEAPECMSAEEKTRVKAFRVARHIIDLLRNPDISIENCYYSEDGQKLEFGIVLNKNTVVEANLNTDLPGSKGEP